jgi:outer membrane protein OmpA-like peptidoglycan-associated protein
MRVRLLLGILLIGLGFVGCTKDEVKPTDPVVVPTPTPTPTPEVTKEKVVVVHFNFNSTRLHADQKKIIKEVVAQHKEGTKIVIVGFTDSQGSKKYNQKLSERRAKAVAKYLKTLKVESDVSGKGEEHLLNGDKTKAEHKLNRRANVAFTVVVK